MVRFSLGLYGLVHGVRVFRVVFFLGARRIAGSRAACDPPNFDTGPHDPHPLGFSYKTLCLYAMCFEG